MIPLTKQREVPFMADEKEKKEIKVRRPQALKRDMQSEKRRLANKAFKAEVSTAIRSLRAAQKSDKALVTKSLAAVYSLMDKGVKTGIYKLNKVSRDKSRLAQSIKA